MVVNIHSHFIYIPVTRFAPLIVLSKLARYFRCKTLLPLRGCHSHVYKVTDPSQYTMYGQICTQASNLPIHDIPAVNGNKWLYIFYKIVLTKSACNDSI